ncbi:unnamed protein product [Ilex paraguariensis]|uniref:PB1 domain-containing protein n=1 Tax=Ilex paraguariensis TaxID=185542 RepID=A0ABC8R1X6_9AQUA
MDPPPLPPHPPTVPNPIPAVATTTATAITTHLSCPDSTNSSPRSHQNDTWDEPLPPVPGAKLRLMCSYGGHIIPRPHDKSLSYVGGDTRIVALDRHSSLLSLSSRLSCTLLNGRQFTLKYQLPNEDLDSLISVSTDEDLENMIEEYDRTTSTSPLKPSRLRLFLFLAKPETAASMGSLLDDVKSETWFVDALNDAGLLPRGVSDSAAIDTLLEFDGNANNESCREMEGEAKIESLDGKEVKNVSDHMHINMPDSTMVETSSSFGSSSSSPSMSNLPPIKVRVEEGGAMVQHQMVGLDEQFSQTSVAATIQKQDDVFVMMSAPPPPLPTVVGGATVDPTVVSDDRPSRVFSDDERSDHGAPGAFRKPPLPLQPQQRKLGADPYSFPSPDSKHGGGCSLPSPDSVASDSSIASATTTLSKHTIYQDPTLIATWENNAPAGRITSSENISDLNSQIQIQQVQDPVYFLPPQHNQQQKQQQFVHSSAHYVHHPATGPMPMSSYYQVYAPPSQQPLYQPMSQQYPVYLFPVSQTQPYNMTVQSNISDATAVASTRPLNPPNPASFAAYNETNPPIYPPKTTTPTMLEMDANLYRTAGTATPTMVQVSSQQYQKQYVGLSQMPHPSQSIAVASATTSDYGSEYAHPSHDQMYYAQHAAAPLPPQYQTMTPASAVLLSQASAQVAADNTEHQIRSSHQL